MAGMRSRALTLKGLLIALATSLMLLSGSFLLTGRNDIQATATPHHNPSFTVITHRSYHTYYQNPQQGDDGAAFQLVNAFAEANDYALNLVIAEHADDIYHALDEGLADIALVGKPLSLSRQNEYPQSLPYTTITTQLIYREGNRPPQTFDDLAGKTIVIRDNEQNREKQHFIAQHYPDIQWHFSNKSTEELIDLLNRGAIAYTLADSHDYITLQARYSRTRVAFPIYYPEQVRLALSQHAPTALIDALNNYIEQSKENGALTQLLDRFYGHAFDSNPLGAGTFFSRVNHRLPKYQKLMQDVAAEYHMDWRLLAAMAYQESHWNPKAVSPTGVRGMMMLTQKTAALMKVDNRIDVEQSLRGGAQYFNELLVRLPESIPYPDKTWFALAAYNVGIGHIDDVRMITEFHGGNPDRWADVKKYLPLLEKKEWHQYTRYGKARGREPVHYVQNIRHFNDLLLWRFPDETEQNTASSNRISSIKALEELLNEAPSNVTSPRGQAMRLSHNNSVNHTL